MKKCIIFEIKSDFGYFKKFSSTSSPTTYFVIPKTTLVGLISAIIGEFDGKTERDLYLEYFNNENCKVSIEVLNPLEKSFIGLNYQNLKKIDEIDLEKVKKEMVIIEDYYIDNNFYDKQTKYTQVNMEVVKNPHYRIYFWHSNENIYDTLKDRLFKHESYFYPFMGTTDFPCEILNISEEEVSIIEIQKMVEIDSVVPKNKFIAIEYGSKDGVLERFSNILSEKQPYLFVKDSNYRRNIDFIDINISLDTKPIFCKVKNYYYCNNKNLLFY